jgi:hypothetical protein
MLFAADKFRDVLWYSTSVFFTRTSLSGRGIQFVVGIQEMQSGGYPQVELFVWREHLRWLVGFQFRQFAFVLDCQLLSLEQELEQGISI